ncbi:hypothetical protein Acr_10g0003720 [Actinidia rufa]|uniref:Uncharacterized protein n=1 Tax=Actinidia rufa TaxID=165716 RepID=A0A7J0FAR0_9ERIC|nr:hypothetical protein Acr_10g0003720 [Actinidia rufa]
MAGWGRGPTVKDEIGGNGDSGADQREEKWTVVIAGVGVILRAFKGGGLTQRAVTAPYSKGGLEAQNQIAKSDCDAAWFLVKGAAVFQ